jgi:DNA-binding NtrC family response regulator
MATTARSDDASEVSRVLVVDPSETAAEFVAEALAYAEPALAVDTAGGVDQALGRLEDTQFDCVVTEYHLDDGNGVALLQKARERVPDVRGVVHTTADEPAIAEAAWNRGFAYARKGHDVERYDVVAGHILGAHGAEG